jgi:predicted amidophosphoribosyltransferase
MYELITPEPGPGICPECFNFTLAASRRCRACAASESHLTAMLAISYAEAGGGLHRALADYKRAAEPAVPYLTDEIARLLSGFLSEHERCVAKAAGVDGFDCVTVVPSTHQSHGIVHPLSQIVAGRVAETAARHSDALAASGMRCTPHVFDPGRFVATRRMDGQNVLLIDDVWTTGANAQSAAAVLKRAGAGCVAAVVIGRYVNGYWGGIAERLERLKARTSTGACALCVVSQTPRPSEAAARQRSTFVELAGNQTGARSVGSRLMDS